MYDVKICRSVFLTLSQPVSLLICHLFLLLWNALINTQPTTMLMAAFTILGTHGKTSQSWNEGILTDSLDGPAASGVLCLGHPDSHFLLAVSQGHSPLEAAHIPWIAFLLHLPSLQWWTKFLSCFESHQLPHCCASLLPFFHASLSLAFLTGAFRTQTMALSYTHTPHTPHTHLS